MNCNEHAASQRQDSQSIFSYYRKLIALRKEYDILAEGDYELLYEDEPDIFAYIRSWNGQKLLVAANFHGGEVPFVIPEEFCDHGVRLIGNYEEGKRGTLRPYEAFMILNQ
ncbi:DUF3459 domain-containing protein [Clostridiales bacterium TF09-2AC]|nr:DUF3459 domain-containing protein [Clostridiales bacterium TF09-2AC]